MRSIKTKPMKMSLDAIKNTMSKAEMKGIIAGSGSTSIMQGSSYTDQNVYNISMSGSGNLTNLATQAYNYAMYGIGVPTTTNNNTSTTTSTWTANANGNYATSDAADIARFMEYMTSPNPGSNLSITDISSFIKGEMAIMTQITQMTQIAQLNGVVGQTGVYDVSAIKALQSQNYTQLQEVVVTKGYNKVVSGAFDTNWGNYDVYTNPYTNDTIQLFTGIGGNIGTSGSSGNTSSPPTDCVFKCMALLGGLYANSSFNFAEMKNNYDTLYNTLISSGIIPPSSGGVDAYLLSNFVDQYFNRVSVTTIDQLSNFIVAGNDNFAIGTYSTGDGSGHAVVIRGVTTDGTQFICTDAQNNNKPTFVDKNCITNFVAINGVCP